MVGSSDVLLKEIVGGIRLMILEWNLLVFWLMVELVGWIDIETLVSAV